MDLVFGDQSNRKVESTDDKYENMLKLPNLSEKQRAMYTKMKARRDGRRSEEQDALATRVADSENEAHRLARSGDAEALRLLDDAVLTAIRADGINAAHEAAAHGHVECLRALAQNGPATVQSLFQPIVASMEHKKYCDGQKLVMFDDTQQGMTAAHLAAAHAHTECLVELHAAFMASAGDGASEPEEESATAAVATPLGASDLSGRTPAHAAAAAGSVACVTTLRALAPASFHQRDDTGRLPLHEAVTGGVCTGELLSAIFDGCDSEARADMICSKDVDGLTPLHLAAMGEAACVTQLLALADNAPTLCVRDVQGCSAVHAAASAGRVDCLEALTATDIFAEAFSWQDDGGNNALHAATKAGHTRCVQLIIEHGDAAILCAAANQDGMRAIELAMQAKHDACIEALSGLGEKFPSATVRLAIVELAKREGVLLLKAKEYGAAIQCNQRAIALLADPAAPDHESTPVDGAHPVPAWTPPSDPARATLAAALASNTALAQLKAQQLKECILSCDQVMCVEPASIKALYRKAQALLGLSQFADSKAVLDQAAKLEPTNTSVTKLLRKCEMHKKKSEKAEKRMYAKMLG